MSIGIIPIPYCALVDILLFLEKKKNAIKKLFNQIKNVSTLKKLLANLKAYKRDSIIQETALAYLVHNFPQMKDVINACKLFNQIDVNGDGKINKAELLKGLQSKIKSDTLEEDVEHIQDSNDNEKQNIENFEIQDEHNDNKNNSNGHFDEDGNQYIEDFENSNNENEGNGEYQESENDDMFQDFSSEIEKEK